MRNAYKLNTIMKKVLLSVFAIAVGLSAFAQQDYQFTQNMFNKVPINPGAAGTNDAICATLFFRQQWIGFDGSPQTIQFSANAPINRMPLIGGTHGVGLTVFQDKLGFETNFMGKLAYSYRRNFGPGELGIGIDGAFYNKSLNGAWIATDDYTQDQAIPNSGASDYTMNLGAGLYYHIPQKLYVGLSSTHVVSGDIQTSVQGSGLQQYQYNYNVKRHYYIMAGYEWDIPSTSLKLMPSVFAKTDAASTQLDINCNVMWNQFLWGGLSYRVQDAAAVLLGIDFTPVMPELENLKLGFAYDVTTSGLKSYSSGSMEVMLNYCFKIPKKPKVNVYKSVRFL